MCSLVTRNNWPRVISNHRKLTCIKSFVALSPSCWTVFSLASILKILGSYFLPHTNTVILLDSYCDIVKETGLFSPGLPNYQESVRVNTGYPVVRTGARSFGRCKVSETFWGITFLGSLANKLRIVIEPFHLVYNPS